MKRIFYNVVEKMYRDISWRSWDYHHQYLDNVVKILDRHRLITKICDDCSDFYRECSDSYTNVDTVKTSWHKIFNNVCLYLGINKRSANVLWSDMCYGNWKHLHKTEEEVKKTESQWFDDFVNDMLYCSDRWSVDRLMRVHWMFRKWGEKAVGWMDFQL